MKIHTLQTVINIGNEVIPTTDFALLYVIRATKDGAAASIPLAFHIFRHFRYVPPTPDTIAGER